MKRIFFFAFLLTCFFCSPAFSGDPRWEGGAKKEVNKIEQKTELPAQEKLTQEELDRQERTVNIISNAPVPLKSPDKVIRILMLPYIDDNETLHSYKYTFVKVEEGKWIIGSYLLEPTKIRSRLLTPISDALIEEEPPAKKKDGK
jgi:hypothetical protein